MSSRSGVPQGVTALGTTQRQSVRLLSLNGSSFVLGTSCCDDQAFGDICGAGRVMHRWLFSPLVGSLCHGGKTLVFASPVWRVEHLGYSDFRNDSFDIPWRHFNKLNGNILESPLFILGYILHTFKRILSNMCLYRLKTTNCKNLANANTARYKIWVVNIKPLFNLLNYNTISNSDIKLSIEW